MLIEAAKGGHTTVVQMLIDYPNSLVGTTSLEGSVVETQAPPPAPPILAEIDRVPPPGSDAGKILNIVKNILNIQRGSTKFG